MQNKIYIPRINYVVFELIMIDVDKYKNNTESYRAQQVETVYLATIPEQFRYAKVARDTIVKTSDKVFVNKASYQPEKVRISGTFGEKPRLIAGTYMDGWARLRQFEESIVEKSKENFQVLYGQFIYALNYYDFIWQKFGSIDIRSFEMSGNARQHATLPQYSCDFELIGDLIKATEFDLMLNWFNNVFGKNGIVGDATDIVNKGLSAAQPILTQVGTGVEIIKTTLDLVGSAQSFIQGNVIGQALHTSEGLF